MPPKTAPKNTPNHEPLIIGWRESVSLPDWGIKDIKTKIDTGARTSAIHVDNIRELPNYRVRFDVIVHVPRAGQRGEKLKAVPITADIVRISRVRPSTGKCQQRLVVSTRVQLGNIEGLIEISLVSRHGMLCRLLLGRSALRGRFLVDPGTPSLLTNTDDTKRKGIEK